MDVTNFITSSDPASGEIYFFKLRCEIKVFLFVEIGKMKILVPFGLNCSPFLLRSTILKHLNSHRANCRDLINDIEAQLSVNDLM